MRRGQNTVEFMVIMSIAMIVFFVTITTSSEQGNAISSRRTDLQGAIAVTDLGNSAREVYAQGLGARKVSLIAFPQSYNASLSGVYPYYIRVRAGMTDYVETFPFQVAGYLPSGPGTFEFLVENNGSTVSIGRWLAFANTSAIGASVFGGENYSEAITISSLSGFGANVTVQCAWDAGDITLSCQNTSFAIAAQANASFPIGFSVSEGAFGVHSGIVYVTVRAVEGNQSIKIPVSVGVVSTPSG